MESDDEVISEGETRVRRSGNVDVTTIPSHIAKTTPIKRLANKILNIKLIRRNGRYILEIKLEDKR